MFLIATIILLMTSIVYTEFDQNHMQNEYETIYLMDNKLHRLNYELKNCKKLTITFFTKKLHSNASYAKKS